jgi:hypothetical protein
MGTSGEHRPLERLLSSVANHWAVAGLSWKAVTVLPRSLMLPAIRAGSRLPAVCYKVSLCAPEVEKEKPRPCHARWGCRRSKQEGDRLHVPLPLDVAEVAGKQTPEKTEGKKRRPDRLKMEKNLSEERSRSGSTESIIIGRAMQSRCRQRVVAKNNKQASSIIQIQKIHACS